MSSAEPTSASRDTSRNGDAPIEAPATRAGIDLLDKIGEALGFPVFDDPYWHRLVDAVEAEASRSTLLAAARDEGCGGKHHSAEDCRAYFDQTLEDVRDEGRQEAVRLAKERLRPPPHLIGYSVICSVLDDVARHGRSSDPRPDFGEHRLVRDLNPSWAGHSSDPTEDDDPYTDPYDCPTCGNDPEDCYCGDDKAGRSNDPEPAPDLLAAIESLPRYDLDNDEYVPSPTGSLVFIEDITAALRGAVPALQATPEPFRAATDIEQRLTALAARMARGTDVCVKGHRADKSEHVHFESPILSWSREIAAIRAALQATGEPPLDVERLGFYDLLDVADAILRSYPPDTIVCSHSVKADRGALTTAAIADLIASCRAGATGEGEPNV